MWVELQYLILEFAALFLHHRQLALGLPELRLVGVVGLHGGVQLVQNLQDLFVNLERDFATLNTKRKLASLVCNQRSLCRGGRV